MLEIDHAKNLTLELKIPITISDKISATLLYLYISINLQCQAIVSPFLVTK